MMHGWADDGDGGLLMLRKLSLTCSLSSSLLFFVGTQRFLYVLVLSVYAYTVAFERSVGAWGRGM